MNMENGQVSRSIVMSNKSFVSAKVLEKLISTLRRLHQTKKTYAQLKNEVVKGLAEAQDVFTNISIPLVRLVDLKVDEMEKDGRKTVVFMTNNFETFREFGIEYETFQSVLSSTRRMLLASEEESFKSKAAYHTDQILYRLKCQVKQLMVLLKMIESLVRTQEQDLTQRFEDHQGFVSRMQNKFVSETMRLHQRVQSMKKSPSNAGQDSLNPSVSEQGYKALLSIALKLQQAVFDGFRKGLSELKDEMEGMINDLATHMSEPLISYLKRLSSEGIMSLVRQLQSLVEQMETDFVQHVPALLAANDRLLLQLRSSEIQLKERENELQKMAKSLKNALLKKGEETEEFRKRMRAQSKRIQELEKAVKEMEAKRFEDRQAVCAKDTQISSQREEALQKQEDFNRQLSMLREEIFQLKKLVENKNMRTSSEIFPAAKMRVMNSTNETRPNRGIQKFPNQKAATNIMRPNNTTFNSLLQPKTDGYTLYQRQPQVRYEKEEKFGDDFLSEILEKEQKGEIRCWNPDNINSRRGTNGTAAGGTTPPKTSLVQLSFHNSSLNLDDGGEASIWGCSPTVPIHGEQQRPNTRSFARSLLQTSPIQKPLPSRNSPYCLRRNHGDPSKRNSPYGLPSSPWRR